MSNVFSFTGALGRDADFNYTPNSHAILSFTVANNVGFGDKQKTNWIRVNVWGKRAEGALKDYLKKGQQVFVSGELSTNEYQKKDGTKGFMIEINANTVDLIGKREQSAPQPTPAPTPTYAPASPSNDVPYDNDIPF